MWGVNSAESPHRLVSIHSPGPLSSSWNYSMSQEVQILEGGHIVNMSHHREGIISFPHFPTSRNICLSLMCLTVQKPRTRHKYRTEDETELRVTCAAEPACKTLCDVCSGAHPLPHGPQRRGHGATIGRADEGDDGTPEKFFEAFSSRSAQPPIGVSISSLKLGGPEYRPLARDVTCDTSERRM